MTMVRLHNRDWGFETNCFVCEPANAGGLRIPFFHDTERNIVTADIQLDDTFSGAPTIVHGGVTLAILDEAMAWACIAIAGQWAMTTETTTRFRKPLCIDRRYRVEAEVIDRTETELSCTARVVDGRDQPRAEATATFLALGEAQAARILGAGETLEQHRGFLRD